MVLSSLILAALTFLFLYPLFTFSGDPKPLKEGEIYNPVPAIMHHIADSHEWHLWGEGKKSVSIPLPLILYCDGKLDVFFSSKFHHGKKNVKIEDREYALDHGHLVEVNNKEFVDLSITKNVASMLLSVMVLLLLFVGAARKSNKDKAPKGLLSFLEPLVLFVRDDIVKPNIGHGYKKYVPYLLTLFFFILVNNLLGLIPAAANLTGNIAVTLVLSFITLIVTNLSGNKTYWGHIFNPPGVPLALMPIMICLLYTSPSPRDRTRSRMPSSA